ncbi:MAG: SPW repeat protein [Firmicutes bacterium]|nr:SPW repeat protein [Bacillota bacterium]
MSRYGWIGIILGIWLIIAPFALGYQNITNAMWNDIILGVLVAVSSYLLGTEARRTGVGGGTETR